MCGIRVRFSQTPERRNVFSYALRVEVLFASGISPKIFVFHQSPAGANGNMFAEFDHVASPLDMQEIPEDAASETVPWYRTDKVTAWFRNVSDMEMAKQMMADDISALQREYGVLSSENEYSVQTVVDFTGNTISLPVTQDTIDLVEAALAELRQNKVDKNAMSDVTVSAGDLESVRKALMQIAKVLGAKVIMPEDV